MRHFLDLIKIRFSGNLISGYDIGMNRVGFLAVLFLVFWVSMVMGFEPPTSGQRVRAIGSTEGLTETLRRALVPDKHFQPIPAPKPHDWLANHPERGQTFDEFVKSKPNRPDKKRNKIYLQPLGKFSKERSPSVERLRDYAAAYLGMKVEILPPL
jgi:archaemetzincin